MDTRTNNRKILIVDDDESVGRTLGRILQRMGREYSLARSAEDARVLLKEEGFDLVLCDIRLPGESGMKLAEHVVSQFSDMAVIMVSGVDDPKTVEKALEIGAYGFIVKPFKISEVMINVSSALRRQSLELWSRIYRENLEQIVVERTAQLEETLEGVIQVVAHSVETRDPYSSGHQRRVAELVCAIGKKLDFGEDRVKGIGMAGLVHDVGKLSVPAEILSKPGRLSASEFGLIKGHPSAGYEILKGIKFPWPIADIVYEHHERMDGSGYPRGLKGEHTLLESRIMAVADVVEAMVSHRPYRPALGIEAALEEISKNKGKLYDSAAAEACVRVFSEDGFRFSSSWSS